MPSKPRTDMLLLTIELWSDMPLFDNESSFKFRADMSLIDSGKWLQISFVQYLWLLVANGFDFNTKTPLSFGNKRLQTQHCNTSVSGSKWFQF